MNKLLSFSLTFILSILLQTIVAQSYEDLVNRSADYLEAKDYLAAEQTLKAALKKEPANPGNILLFSNLGTVQRHLEKYDEALISYNIVINRYPNSVAALHNRAALFCEIDSLNEALKDYNAILLYAPDDMEALYRRGLIHLDKNNLYEAELDFEKIKEIDPKNLEGEIGLGIILKRKGEWKKAEELYSDLIYDNRTNADLYLNRAECYVEDKKMAKAREDLNKAQEYGNNSPLLYILKGRVSLSQYDKNSAKEYFMKAQELGANPAIIDELLKYCK